MVFDLARGHCAFRDSIKASAGSHVVVPKAFENFLKANTSDPITRIIF